MPTVVWKGKSSLFTAGVNTVLVEQPDSPTYVWGESCVRKFKGLHSLCMSSGVDPYTLGTGAMSGWYVTKCTVNRLPKQIGELIIEYKPVGGSGGSGGGSALPADEVGLEPFEINPRLETNSYFTTLTPTELASVRDAVDGVDPTRSTAYAALGVLAKKLADKQRKGMDSYYLAGITYTWATYSWSMPGSMSLGGVIEAPGGPWSSDLNTTDFAWLRQADSLSFDGSKYKLTSRWIGAPNGHWDTDIY